MALMTGGIGILQGLGGDYSTTIMTAGTAVTSNVLLSYNLGQYQPPTVAAPPVKATPDEFAWLRGRVAEVSW